MEGTGAGSELQAEDGECVDEDGPISPSDRDCPPEAKDDEEVDGSEEEDDEDALQPAPSPSATSRLNPAALRDTGPPDR